MSVSDNEPPMPSAAGPENGDGTGEDLEYKRALLRAMNLLAVRMHSAYQLRTKLARKFSREVIEKVLHRLEEINLLDDLEFAREYVRQRVARSPRAPALLIKELRSRGVCGENAAGAVEETLSETGLTEQELACQATRKRITTLSGESDPRKREKLFRFLSSRGFQASIARLAIEEILGDFEDD
ncbi:regulatory protein RecX [Gemmatimonadota bacterium]